MLLERMFDDQYLFMYMFRRAEEGKRWTEERTLHFYIMHRALPCSRIPHVGRKMPPL